MDQLKLFWLSVTGSDLTFYKSNTQKTNSKILYHSLINTFVEDPDTVDNVTYDSAAGGGESKETYWPIRIILPSEKTLVLHFRSQEEQLKWCTILREQTR
jgi:hypothetical protein